MEALRILHIIDSLGAGGKERRLLELLKAFEKMGGVENHLVTLSETHHFGDLHKLGFPITCIPRRSRRDWSVFPRLYRLCRSYRPDLIHSWESMCSVYAAPVAKLQNIRFINAMITTGLVHKNEKKWFRSRLTFPFSDMVLSNSRAGLATFEAPAHKSFFVHNGFDFSRTRNLTPARHLRQAHGIRAPRVIGMVAGIDHRKDLGNFVRAARHLLQQREDVCFVAVGDGPLLAYYRDLAGSGPGAGRIHFVGRQSSVESFIDLFEIGLLLTDKRHAEGISNAIMEYMALGKPVVATLSGGNPELVLEGVTGFLVPPDDGKLLIERLNWLLDNPESGRKMGGAGRCRVAEAFSIDAMAQKTLQLYHDCLRKNGFGKRSMTLKAPAPPV